MALNHTVEDEMSTNIMVPNFLHTCSVGCLNSTSYEGNLGPHNIVHALKE